MVRKPHNSRNNVTKLQNEFVSTLQEKENWRKKQKKRLKRNLTIFAIVAVVSFGLLFKTFIGQNKILASKAEEKDALLAQLAEVEEEQLLLTRQLEQLNDDEYIAKLAREKYFLSNENETIFSIPKINKKDEEEDEKSGEKE